MAYGWELEENAMANWSPEELMPSQWADMYGRKRPESPEHKLQYACLLDALRQFTKTHRECVKIEIQKWADSNSVDSPFAFLAICEELNIDADRIRRAMRTGSIKALPRKNGRAYPVAA